MFDLHACMTTYASQAKKKSSASLITDWARITSYQISCESPEIGKRGRRRKIEGEREDFCCKSQLVRRERIIIIWGEETKGMWCVIGVLLRREGGREGERERGGRGRERSGGGDSFH